ncbi:MAG: glucosaminidase domain-containing protein [Roseiflexaceae bacterium]|nr:glucosaminidase domain-containing protein [Roseiflexaceae bacterium]
MANHKDHRQLNRERISGDDLEVPVQTRERTVRKPTDFRVSSDSLEARLPAQAPMKPRASVPSVPLIPPEPNQAASAGRNNGNTAGMQPTYPGTVINEARQRQATGRLGEPQPLAQSRPVLAQPKSIPIKPDVAMRADVTPLSKPVREAQPRANKMSEQGAASDRLRRILPNAVAEQQRAIAAEERAPQAVRRAISVPYEEWLPYPMPVIGPQQALILCSVLCVVLIWGLFYTPLGKPIGAYTGPLTLSEWVDQTIGIAPTKAQITKQPGNPRMQPMLAPIGETSIVRPPSMTADQIDAVLSSYGSPAAGNGQDFYNLGVEYGIDPAYALAFFIHESSAGTNSGWAGLKSDGSTTHNIGNIICAGYPTCYNRFRDYPSWSVGIDDWYKLIATEYVNGRSAFTVEQIIPVYAPAFENNVPGYIQAVNALVDGWRQGNH